MASDMGALFRFIMRLFTYEFTIYGVTFSMFQVFAFSTVASILGWFIGKVFFDD